MRLLIAVFLLPWLFAAPTRGQDPLIGTWERVSTDEDGETSHVWQFRDNDLLLQNDYQDGVLTFVYVYPYRASGSTIDIAEGMKWRHGPGQSDYELLESRAEESVATGAAFNVSGDVLSLRPSNRTILSNLLERMQDDPDSGLTTAELLLPVDLDDEQLVIDDELLSSIIQRVFVVAIAKELGLDPSTLGLQQGADLVTDLNAIEVALFYKIVVDTIAEQDLEIRVPSLVTLDGDPSVVVASVFVELGVKEDQIESPTRQGLESSLVEVSALDGLAPEIEAQLSDTRTSSTDFKRQSRVMFFPPGSFILTNGQSAVTAIGWSAVKTRVLGLGNQAH